ncbi:hypothetical protein GGF49_004795 [Coemansia sp. RSA 1853]|nr:hypothetical protein LPJ76_004872 [Coemansia sp. RSA 638]KAJ2540008.1 hypothetical protein GGF49_004795 [Coemansia sp. RSA 1853]
MSSQTGMHTRETPERRGLKKWLSMKVGGGHRRSPDNDSVYSSAKVRHSVGMLPGAHTSRKQGHTANGHISEKPAGKEHGLRNRLSLPVTQRLQRKGAVEYDQLAHNMDELPTILEFGLDSPIPSPESALTPPPTIESDCGRIVDIIGASAMPYHGSVNPKQFHFQRTHSDKVEANGQHIKDSGRTGKQRPPLRKRSLIYAMYCTAQPDKESNQVCMQRSHGSMISANNGSAMFVSCTSLPSTSDGQESANSTSPCQAVISSAQYSQQQQASDMSVGFMVVDAVEHLAAVRRRELGKTDSDARSVCSATSNSSSGSIYIGAECMVVEAEAYRCNNKYAPRLSTIERAHDGRLLLKPSIEAPPDMQNIPDSGNTSTAEASPYPDAPAAPASSLPKDANENLHSVCVEDFPPMPQVFPQSYTARKPVNSLLIHAINLGVDSTENLVLSQSPESPAADAMSSKAPCSDTLPAEDNSSPLLIATPLESPAKSTETTANTSVVSTVSADNSAGDSSEASTASPDKVGMDGRCSEALAEVEIDTTDMHSTSDMPSTSEQAVTCTKDNSDPHCHADIADVAGTVSPPQFNLDELPAAGLSSSYDSMTQLTDSTCGDSHLYSMFSDISDIDLRSLGSANLSRVPGGAWANQSILFGGHYNDTMRPHALAFSDAPIPPQLDSRARVGGSGSIGNSTLDDMPLAHVAALTPNTVVVQQLESLQGSLTASKTSRLTSVLAKATQLDGLRRLHRKSKHAGRSEHPGDLRRGSSSSNTTSSSSKIMDETRECSMRSPLSKKSPKKLFRFNELVAVYETWNRNEYDRRGIPTTRLDAELIEQIKQELNDYKAYEMQVHESSRQLTHFIY